jgi:glycosyltransferase involved in cell wall biosynthesis
VSAVNNPMAMAKNMNKLIGNEKLRQRLSACALEDAREFSIEKSGLKLVEVYKELLDK